MNIAARISSSFNHLETSVQTNEDQKVILISPKSSGYGSSVNGGEMLLLALATCFCNDLYREAAKRKILLDSVEVECSGEFGAEGEAGSNFKYTANVKSSASPEEIQDLIIHTDKIAEIHNTLRKGAEVVLINNLI